MVFIALNNNNEIIFAHNSSKGKYKCIYCNEKIFFVNKSKNDKIAHFRHNILCKYSESINNNYDFYTNEFHFKWTRNLVKPQYLYGYWNNKDIADVINTNKIRIIIRRQLLKENYYINDENIIWILDGELRNGIIKQITYENNEIKYYFCNDNLYDLKMISSKHKIYIDYGLNQIIEIIPENIKFNYCICNIININNFITMYFDDITYNQIEYINENLKIQELYGYNFIENKIEKYNKEIKNEQIIEENKYKLDCEKLKNYIDNYNNLSKLYTTIKIKITYRLNNNASIYRIDEFESYIFLYDEKYSDDFYKVFSFEYHIFVSDFKFRRQSCIESIEYIKDIENNNDKILKIKNLIIINNKLYEEPTILYENIINYINESHQNKLQIIINNKIMKHIILKCDKLNKSNSHISNCGKCKKCKNIINNFTKNYNITVIDKILLEEENNKLQKEIQNLEIENNFKEEIITFEELNIFYTQYCKKINTEYNKIDKLIIDKYINKLDFTHNIKCINCKISLKLLTNDNLINITENINNIKEFNSCENCKLLYDSQCNICESKLCEKYNYTELKFYNNKYYHLDCYNDNINCQICNLENDNFHMHDLCFEILEKKCIHCDKNILNNENFKYIDDTHLNNIIKNFNNDFIEITPKSFFKEYIHINCMNINYLLKIISNDNNNIITENIFNKIKILEYNSEEINTILCSKCFLCNKKQFRLNLNKYTYESYMLYLERIQIFEINEFNKVYSHYNINDKKYAYLCYICKDKIKNNNFYNKFFFDNLEKEHNNISEKQINILNKIKQMCNT